MCHLSALTPVLMTPEHDNREAEAQRRTQTQGSLSPGPPQSSLTSSPPAPGSAPTAGSPSTAPGRSL